MKQVTITLPTIEQVEFSIECMPEDIPVEGNASAIDQKTDKMIADNIYKELESGNSWAWCTVKVTARYKGIKGTEYLGCCSYKSQKDFEKNSGYYQDMKETAFSELLTNLKALND